METFLPDNIHDNSPLRYVNYNFITTGMPIAITPLEPLNCFLAET